MLDELRDRIAAFLDAHHTCVISAAGPDGVRAIPVRYHHENLILHCILPRWADIAYYLRRGTVVAITVQDPNMPAAHWLTATGIAEPTEAPGHPAHRHLQADLYTTVRVILCRVSLLDERRGWGARETLETPTNRT